MLGEGNKYLCLWHPEGWVSKREEAEVSGFWLAERSGITGKPGR